MEIAYKLVTRMRAVATHIRTSERYDLDLLAILVLVSGRNPLAVRAAGGHAADADEHEARGHNERGDDGAGGPGPAGAEDGKEEANAGEDDERNAGGGAVLGVVDRGFVRDRDGGVGGELLGERTCVEAATGWVEVLLSRILAHKGKAYLEKS